MPILDAKRTRIARTGTLWSADETTEFPTAVELLDPTFVFPAGWTAWGYLGPDGIGNAINETSEDLRAFQNNEIYDSVITDSGADYTVPVLETRKETIEIIFETTVDPATGSYVISPGKQRTRHKFIWETVDTRSMKKKFELFTAQVSEIGEITYTSTASVLLSPTLKVFGDIQVHDEFLKEPAVTP